MRILADENFPGLSVQELRRLGHDVLWVRTVMPGARDDAVLACAQTEERLLVTLSFNEGRVMRDVGNFVNLLDRIYPAMRGAGIDL